MRRISDRIGILAVVMVFIVLLFTSAMFLVENKRHKTVTKEKINDRKLLTQEIISAKSEYCKSLAFDYSFWDDMVVFAKNPSREWEELNLKPALKVFHTDMMWVYSKGLTLSRYTSIPDAAIYQNLNTDLVKLFNDGAFKHFFTRINNQVVELHTAAIQPGTDTLRISAPQGYFITGKIWNDKYLNELGRLSQTRIQIINSPDEAAKIQTNAFLLPLNNEYGKPEVWLKATIDSGYFALLWQSSIHQVIITLFTGLLLALLVYLFMRIYFLRPFQTLTIAVATFNRDYFNKIRNHSHEIDSLIYHIEKLFIKNQTLEHEIELKNATQKECQKREKMHETYLNAVTESLIIADVSSLMIKDINENACRLYQIDREQFMKMRLSDIWPDVNIGGFFSQDGLQGKTMIVLNRKNGNVSFYVSLRGISFKNEEGELLILAVSDITEKVMVENALRESENKLKLTLNNTLELNRRITESEAQLKDFIDNTIESIIWITPEKTIKTFNKAAEKINFDVYGVELKEGQNILAYIFDKPEFEIHFNASMSGEKRWVEKYIFSSVSQKSYWFEFRYSPVFNASNSIVGVLLSTIDITTRKKAEIELQKNQARLKEAERIARMGHFELDLQTGQSFWSEETYRILDIPVSTPPSFDLFRNTIYEADREFIYFLLDQLVIEGKNFNQEFRIKKMNGEIKYVQSIAYVADKEKNPVIFGTIQDISERIQVEKILAESEEKYRTVVESVEEGIGVLNPELKFEFVNHAALSIFGIDMQNIVGHNLAEFLSPKQLEILKHSLVKRKKGEPVITEIEVERFDGVKRNILVTTTPKFEKGTFTGTFNIFRDITERKKAEEQLRVFNENLKELNATKDKFFSIIAHDLKNPFNTIAGFAQLLTANIDLYDNEKIKHFIEIIYNSSTGASALLENLLQWSLSQSGRIAVVPQSFSLNALIQGTMNLMKETAMKKNIRFVNQITGSYITHADKDMISLIVRNLLSNAIKFTPEGGEVSVSAISKDNHHIITINDTGVGIEPEILKHLFQIDYSHSTAGTSGEKGSGLGLILCKEFIMKNHGDIWVESELEKGTRFSFSLPAHNE